MPQTMHWRVSWRAEPAARRIAWPAGERAGNRIVDDLRHDGRNGLLGRRGTGDERESESEEEGEDDADDTADDGRRRQQPEVSAPPRRDGLALDRR